MFSEKNDKKWLFTFPQEKTLFFHCTSFFCLTMSNLPNRMYIGYLRLSGTDNYLPPFGPGEIMSFPPRFAPRRVSCKWMPVATGLGWEFAAFPLKMWCHPAGDWNHGWRGYRSQNVLNTVLFFAQRVVSICLCSFVDRCLSEAWNL